MADVSNGGRHVGHVAGPIISAWGGARHPRPRNKVRRVESRYPGYWPLPGAAARCDSQGFRRTLRLSRRTSRVPRCEPDRLLLGLPTVSRHPTGSGKLLGYVDADKTIQGVPYPLYVAALFIGLTQPIVPVFSRFGEAQRDFFHDQIEVPRRLIDLAERLASAVEARAAADKRLLAREVRNLVS